jgi:biopolymer transport protein ExbB/TolQ
LTESILTPLRDTMHSISSGLLVPTIVILMLLLAVSVFELGSLLVELFTERRRQREDVGELIKAFQGKKADQIMEIIEKSGLFRRQKRILTRLAGQSALPPASLQALARNLLAGEEGHYAKITGRTDLVARLGPMFGLMGTLIPLGPGLMAFGQGNTKALADSLLIAFDTTVTGLAAAGIAYAVSRLRKRWYEEYLSSLEALMESLLEVFARGPGTEKGEAED